MKRKIIINPTEPSVSENPKEFKDLLKDYNSAVTSTPTNWIWKASAALAAACIAGLIIFNINSQESAEKDSIPPTHTPVIAEHKTDFELPVYSQKVDRKEETIIVTPSGVIMNIPADAFTSESGSDLGDSVTVSLTQYDDPLTILLSQIPMHYDSAGVKNHFQSDGMFNLSASDEKGQVALQKPIDVFYPQTTGRTNSNTYFLENNEWSYHESTPTMSYEEACEKTIYRFSKDENTETAHTASSTEVKDLRKENQELKAEITALENSKPLEPKQQNFDNYRFVLDVNPAEFPELNKFENVIFEVKDSRFNYAIYKDTWNDIDVKKSQREGRYLITLKNTKRVEIFDVYPVLDEEEFAESFASYSETLTEIEESKKDLSLQIAENEKREQEFLDSLESYRTEERKLSKKQRIINELGIGLSASSVYRQVAISGLGTCNFDIGIPLPKLGVPVPADFVIAENSSRVNAVSLVNVEDNIYYSFTRAEFPEFRYVKNKKHILVSVLPDAGLAVYRSDLAGDHIKRNQPHRFKLELTSAESVSELREIMGLQPNEPTKPQIAS